MNKNLRNVFVGLLCLQIALLLNIGTAEAGRKWVTDFDNPTPWQVQRACQNGVEILAVHRDGLSADSSETISIPIRPRLLTHQPDPNWWDEDEEFYNFPTDSPTAEIYYPAVGHVGYIVASEPNTEPLTLSIPGMGSADYFVYVTDNVYFYETLPIDSWVLLGLANLVQVEDCFLDDQSSSSTELTNQVMTAASHMPTSRLLYRVEGVPSDAQLQLGDETVNEGDQFSAARLDSMGLTISGGGQDQSVKLSASGTYRVSADHQGDELQNGDSVSPSISADGSIVAYQTDAIFDATNDVNGEADIVKSSFDYRIEAVTMRNTLVSRDWRTQQTVAGRSTNPAISAHGRTIVFESTSTLLNIDGLPCTAQSYVLKATETDITQEGCRSADNWGGDGSKRFKNPDISGDGQIAFETDLALPSTIVNVDSNGGSDILVGIVPVSAFLRTSGGGPLDPLPPITLSFTGDQASSNPDISDDGQVVAFDSNATDLVGLDTNGVKDIFVKRASNLTIASVNSDEQRIETGGAFHPSISRFGEHIAFSSTSDELTVHDTAGISQIYVRDDGAGCTIIASVTGSGLIGNEGSFFPSISANGQFIAFQSYADNLVDNDTNNVLDVFVFDRDADNDGSFYEDETSCQPGPSEIKRVSVASDGTQADGASAGADMSANGEFVAFTSFATNLVDDDTNQVADVFVHYLGFTVDIRFSDDGEGPTNPAPYSVYMPFLAR